MINVLHQADDVVSGDLYKEFKITDRTMFELYVSEKVKLLLLLTFMDSGHINFLSNLWSSLPMSL